MQNYTLIADISSVFVFLWLTYKVACIGLATPGRCRLLRGLLTELQHQNAQMTAELQRLAGQVREGRIADPITALRLLPEGKSESAAAGMPAEHRPASLLHRIVTARLAGEADRAWDEYRYWLRRVSFGWSAQLAFGKQAKEFGLLYTVIGALLAFAHLSQVSKPFEVFGALSLAMLTTIAGLLLSLLVSHCLVQQFCSRYRELQIESERIVLEILRRAGQVPVPLRRSRKTGAGRKRSAAAERLATQPVLNNEAASVVRYSVVPHDGNGGVRCIQK